VGVDPVEEVGDFGEDARCSLASASSPGDDSDDVELSRLGLGWADERSTGVAHAGGVAVGSEPDHARLDHFWPTGLQVGILPDLTLKLLEGVGHISWGFDEAPSGEPASFGAVVVISGVGHAGRASVCAGEVNIGLQFDQSNVVFNGVGFVESRVDDDLFHLHILFGAIIIFLAPFADTNSEL